jgi:hypothetical protein
MNRFKIYPAHNFAFSKLHKGVQTFEDIYKLAKEFREDPDFSTVHFQLTDMRECSFDFDVSKIPDMVNLVKDSQKFDNQKLGVYIVDQPNETAYLTLFFDLLPYHRELCSTEERAYELLNIQIPFDEFKELISI